MPEAPGASLPDAVISDILDAAAGALPDEACGLLIGRLTDGTALVTTQRSVANEADRDRSRRFAIPAARVRAAQREAQRDGLDVIGFWHSHPRGPASPSVEDLEAALPGYLYGIVDVRTGTLTVWRLRDDRRAFEPVDY